MESRDEHPGGSWECSQEGREAGMGLENLSCNVPTKASGGPICWSALGVAIWKELTPNEIIGLHLCNPPSASQWIRPNPGEGITMGRAPLKAGTFLASGNERLSSKEDLGRAPLRLQRTPNVSHCPLWHPRQTHTGFFPTHLQLSFQYKQLLQTQSSLAKFLCTYIDLFILPSKLMRLLLSMKPVCEWEDWDLVMFNRKKTWHSFQVSVTSVALPLSCAELLLYML